MHENDYFGLMETLYLTSIPGLKESILAEMNAPASDFVDEKDAGW